jgi:hypothetical protein
MMTSGQHPMMMSGQHPMMSGHHSGMHPSGSMSPQMMMMSGQHPMMMSGQHPMMMSGQHPMMGSGQFLSGQYPMDPPMKSGMFGMKYWSVHAMDQEKKRKIEEEDRTIFGKRENASFSVRPNFPFFFSLASS